MNRIKKCKTETLVAFALSFLHCCITFFTDKNVFLVTAREEPFNYCICKLLLFTLLFFIYRSLYRIAIDKDRKNYTEFQVLKYALPYLVPIIAVLIFKLPQGFLSNDETLIFKEAANLASYTWFYYITTYYYIVCMMLIPSWLGPILVKVFIQLIVCGYCIFRLSKYRGFTYGRFLYFAFLLFPVLAYTTSAHRIPIYFLLYLFMIFTLLMDHLENIPYRRSKLICLLTLGAVLTQWRTEGIYLVGVVPILLIITYKELRNKKAVLGVLLAFLFIQYIVAIPQNGLFPDRLNDQADNRMGPFYAYTITNMYRNGLDLERNKEDLALVDRYLSLDTIKSINEYLKDTNYEDVLILYYKGYTGVRPDADAEDYAAYTRGCRNIFLNNLPVLLKTRMGAFSYASTPYSVVWPSGGIMGLVSFAFSLFKALAYNLFIPHIILLGLWIYSIFRKRIFTFTLTSGLLCHWFIVFILAPASYFKYYFPIYIIMYFYVTLLLIQTVYNKRHKEDSFSFLP